MVFLLSLPAIFFHKIYGNFDILFYSCSTFVLQVSWQLETLLCTRQSKNTKYEAYVAISFGS